MKVGIITIGKINKMKNFIKENLVLVIGLVLPVLLIVLFFVATVIPKSMGTPPQYEMLFTTTRYDYQNKPEYVLDFYVKNQQLIAKSKKNDEKNYNNASKILMAYDGKTETVREITFDAAKLIDAAKLTDGAEMILEETKNLSIDTNVVAPDGYTLESSNYGSSGNGLVGGLFGGGYRNTGYRLKKGSVGYKVPNLQPDYYYSQLQFIGWVAKNNGAIKN